MAFPKPEPTFGLWLGTMTLSTLGHGYFFWYFASLPPSVSQGKGLTTVAIVEIDPSSLPTPQLPSKDSQAEPPINPIPTPTSAPPDLVQPNSQINPNQRRAIATPPKKSSFPRNAQSAQNLNTKKPNPSRVKPSPNTNPGRNNSAKPNTNQPSGSNSNSPEGRANNTNPSNSGTNANANPDSKTVSSSPQTNNPNSTPPVSPSHGSGDDGSSTHGSTNPNNAHSAATPTNAPVDNGNNTSQGTKPITAPSSGITITWTELRLSVPNVDLPDQLATIANNPLTIGIEDTDKPNYGFDLVPDQPITLEVLLLVNADGRINIYSEPIKILGGTVTPAQALTLVKNIQQLSWQFVPTIMDGEAIDQEYYAKIILSPQP